MFASTDNTVSASRLRAGRRCGVRHVVAGLQAQLNVENAFERVATTRLRTTTSTSLPGLRARSECPSRLGSEIEVTRPPRTNRDSKVVPSPGSVRFSKVRSRTTVSERAQRAVPAVVACKRSQGTGVCSTALGARSEHVGSRCPGKSCIRHFRALATQTLAFWWPLPLRHNRIPPIRPPFLWHSPCNGPVHRATTARSCPRRPPMSTAPSSPGIPTHQSPRSRQRDRRAGLEGVLASLTPALRRSSGSLLRPIFEEAARRVVGAEVPCVSSTAAQGRRRMRERGRSRCRCPPIPPPVPSSSKPSARAAGRSTRGSCSCCTAPGQLAASDCGARTRAPCGARAGGGGAPVRRCGATHRLEPGDAGAPPQNRARGRH